MKKAKWSELEKMNELNNSKNSSEYEADEALSKSLNFIDVLYMLWSRLLCQAKYEEVTDMYNMAHNRITLCHSLRIQ